jgi:hypothetical protein
VDVVNSKVGELNNPELGSSVVVCGRLNDSSVGWTSKTSQRVVPVDRVDIDGSTFDMEVICCICEECSVDVSVCLCVAKRGRVETCF